MQRPSWQQQQQRTPKQKRGSRSLAMDALTRGQISTTTADPALIFGSAGPSCSIKRAAAAAISAESWSFDQLRQVCALWRQPHSDWSGGFSAHSRPCSEGLSYGDNDSCRRAPEFVLDKLSVAESWWSGPEDESLPPVPPSCPPGLPRAVTKEAALRLSLSKMQRLPQTADAEYP